MSDERNERLERFKRRVEADLAPIRNTMDELRAEMEALEADAAQPKEARE